MTKFFFFSIFFITLFFSSCTEYYTPKRSKLTSSPKYFNKMHYIGSRIDYSVYDATVLKNGDIYTVDGKSDEVVEKGERLVSYDIHTKTLFFYDVAKKRLILKGSHYLSIPIYKKVATASLVTPEVIALVYTDNSIGMYSLAIKKEIFNLNFVYQTSVGSRLPPPMLVSNLYLVYPLLSGKLAVYNTQIRKIENVIEISKKDNFNNFIYLDKIRGRLIAATMDRLVIISNDFKNIAKSRDITPMFMKYSGGYLYVASLSGNVYKYNARSLKLKASLNLKYASYIGLAVYRDSLYLLEDSSYLIRAKKDLSDYKVLDMNGYTGIKSFSYKNHILYGLYDLILGTKYKI